MPGTKSNIKVPQSEMNENDNDLSSNSTLNYNSTLIIS